MLQGQLFIVDIFCCLMIYKDVLAACLTQSRITITSCYSRYQTYTKMVVLKPCWLTEWGSVDLQVR